MAVTENLHTGNGSKTNYSFTFPYLKTTDIKASVDGTVVTNFTAGSPTATEIQFNTAPANNAAIRIYRDTATDNLSATFYAGSAIKSEDLNDNFLQNLYVTQEAKRDADAAWQDGDETINSTETWHTSDDTRIATTKAIENRVTNKIKTALTGDVEGGQSITVTDNSPSDGKITVAVTNASIGTTQLANDAVNGDKIADDAIDSEHYAAGSIDNEHLADDAVGIDELGPNAVVNASVKSDAAIEFTKLENLDSAKILVGNGSNKATEVSMSGDVAISNTGATTIQSGAVERGMLAADLIDGTKIDDDAVDSDHIAAGAIDTEHIGAAQVTLAKTADLADTKIIVGNGSNRPTAVNVSGDATIANTGAVTIANDAVTTNKINNDAVTTAKIADQELKTLAGMPTATASVLADTTALTASTAELNLLDNKSFKDSSAGTLNTTSDTEIPSSKVIAAHVASSQTAIGGFVTIADEVSFPATASMPANGVVVSINNAAGIVVNGSGVSTTGRTTDGTPATVTINNFPSSLNGETLAAGVGLMVTATSTSNTYNYHKLLAAETDVKQLSDDINDFNARYRVAGSAPGSNNDAGDMYFDTGSNKMKVYNGTTSTWDDVASVGNFYINTLSSTGSGSDSPPGGSATFNGTAQKFALSNAPTMAQQLIVSINGVIQKPNAGTSVPSEGFAINGNDIIFSAAPASGSDYFIVTQGSSVSIGTPSDNTVSTAKIQNQAVNSAKIQDASIVNGDIADDTIAEVKLDIHNAPATDKYLKYTSNGMEWSDGASEGTDVKSTGESGTTKFLRVDGDGTSSWQVPPDTVYTHPNHSGEVTSSADGAQTIASNVVDEDNLKISNTGSDGQYLQKQSGDTGGLTWATVDLTNLNASNLTSGTIPNARFPSTLPAVSGANLTNLPASAGEYTATASNTLTAGQVVFLNSSGQLKKPSNTITANNPVDVGTFVGMYTSRTTFQPRATWDPVNKIGVNWASSSAYNNGSSAQLYLTPFTLNEGSTPALMVMGSQTSASSASPYSSVFQCICVGQPTSTTSRFLAVWKQTNNYSVAQCFDTNGSNSLQFIGSQVQVGHLGYGYRVYSDPQGICKTGTAGQYLWTGYNGSAARGGVELLTVDASGNVTRGNSLETDAAHAQQSDKGVNGNCFYDPDADRVIVWWQHESSPHYHNWTNFRVNGASLTKNSNGNIGAYCTSTVCSFDDTLNKFCMVICDQTNNRQAVLIGNATSSGLSYTTTQIFNSNNWSSEASGTIDANSGRVIVSYAQSGNTSPLNIESAPLSGNSPGTWTTAANLPSYLMSKYHWHGPMLNIPHLSELMFFVHQYNSGYSYRRAMEYGLKVAVVSTDLTADNFLGIAKTTGSGSRTINTIGAINENVSGLTVGSKYYAQGDGTIATSPDGLAGSIPVGIALASNKLLLKH